MTVRAHLTLYTKTWRLMLQPRQQKHQAVQRGRSLISNIVDVSRCDPNCVRPAYQASKSDPRLTFGAAARYGLDSAGPVGRRGKLKHPPVQLSEVAAIV